MSTQDQGTISHLRKYLIFYIAIVFIVLAIVIFLTKNEIDVEAIKELFIKYKEEFFSFVTVVIGAFLGALFSLKISNSSINNKLRNTPELLDLLADSNAIRLTNKLRKMGIKQVYDTRKDAFGPNGLINYLPVFEKASKRFFMGAITLDTARHCFQDTHAEIRLKEKLSRKDFEFKIITANPLQDYQMKSVQDAKIELGHPKKETNDALDFFLYVVQDSNRQNEIRVSSYLPSHFFLLADDELFVQGYMDGMQSCESLTIQLQNLLNSDDSVFNRYVSEFNNHFDRGTPWFKAKSAEARNTA